MIRRFLLKLLINALALWVADWLLGNFLVSGGVTGYLIGGVVLGTLNTFLRPLLKLLSLPLIVISLGFFTFLINVFILWLAAHWTGSIMISGLSTYLWATIIISAVNVLFEPGADQ